MKRFLLLSAIALVAAACGSLPVTINLLPTLEKAGLDHKEFDEPLNDVPANTDLSEIGSLTLDLPDADGLTLNFPAPNLPAVPASMAFDFRVHLRYAFTCVSGLGGTLKATGYLSPDSPPWDSPLAGVSAQAELKESGDLVLEGRAELTREQINAILAGQATIGFRIELTGLQGQTGDCTPRISGSYKIERATVEVRFL